MGDSHVRIEMLFNVIEDGQLGKGTGKEKDYCVMVHYNSVHLFNFSGAIFISVIQCGMKGKAWLIVW